MLKMNLKNKKIHYLNIFINKKNILRTICIQSTPERLRYFCAAVMAPWINSILQFKKSC